MSITPWCCACPWQFCPSPQQWLPPLPPTAHDWPAHFWAVSQKRQFQSNILLWLIAQNDLGLLPPKCCALFSMRHSHKMPHWMVKHWQTSVPNWISWWRKNPVQTGSLDLVRQDCRNVFKKWPMPTLALSLSCWMTHLWTAQKFYVKCCVTIQGRNLWKLSFS